MSDEKWQKVKDIFDVALELKPEKRQEYLKTVCGSDNDLLREVESLLANSTDSGSFMEHPAVGEVADVIVEKKKNKIVSEGQKISHYKIIRLLGKGGMGEVYLAEDTILERKVAIKFLTDEFSQDKEKLNRFIQEAKAASALNHPNIITIHEIGKFDDTHYIATEFIEGETLSSKLKGESLKFDFLLKTAIQIASALDTAHTAGIVHRDIKPDNVIIRPDGLVKILDFGIAKLTENFKRKDIESEEQTAMQVKTSTGMIIGTANYMSPEQAKGKEVDARTDIFSFGVVLYEMLSGNLPFKGETAMEVISAILKDEPKPLANPDIPPEIEKIISKALRKDRNERYQIIKDLLIDLKDVKRELEFLDKLEKTVQPNKDEAKTQFLKNTTVDENEQTITVDNQSNTSISGSKFSKSFIISLTILLISAIGLGYWYFFDNSRQIKSIAVMPFVNESGNEDVEYLSDGMTETLINSFTNIPNLSVKARSTVFYYKGKNKSPKEIGEELGVEAVLLGRVVQQGDDIKLSLELVDTKTLDAIFSETYNHKMSNLVALQSEIAKNVSDKLKLKLSSEEEKKVIKSDTANPEAYQAYLKGRYYWSKRNEKDMLKGIEYFKQAIDLDSNYALAWSGLADSYSLIPHFSKITWKEAMPKAKSAAEKAIKLDPQLAEAHTSLANILAYYDWNFPEAEKEYKTAIKINPNYANAHKSYGVFLSFMSRHNEAIRQIKTAQELDPVSPITVATRGVIYIMAGKFDESIEPFRKALELYPNLLFAKRYLASSLAHEGKYDEAFSTCNMIEKDTPAYNLCSALVYARQGNKKEAYEFLAKGTQGSLEDKFYKTIVYSELGDNDKVLQICNELFEDKTDIVLRINGINTYNESLEKDPRFKDLIKRIGLPE